MNVAETPDVCIVGAGPGSGDYLTHRGARLLARAHAVVYDRDLDLHRLGVRDGCPAFGVFGEDPAVIASTLVRLVDSGRPVVRLVRGDPGDTSEPVHIGRLLADSGMSFEVVPGVPLYRVAAACAGVLNALEGNSHGRHNGSAREPWVLVGTPDELLVGLERRHRDASASVFMLVSAPGLPRQRSWSGPPESVRGLIASLPARERHVLFDLGGAKLASASWFESRPLFGRRIAVTRPLAQSESLIGRLEALGADPVPLPTIRIRPMDDGRALVAAARRVGEYDWIVFTSANGVHAFWAALEVAGADSRALAGVAICAIGPGTAAALEPRGVRADLLPERFVAEGVIDALTRAIPDLADVRILLPRASEGRTVLPETLRRSGATVDDVAAYRTVPEFADRAALREVLSEGPLDYITFTSSSTVRNFTAMFGTDIGPARTVSIGPITSATARECGLQIDFEADPHSVDGIVDAILGAEAGRR